MKCKQNGYQKWKCETILLLTLTTIYNYDIHIKIFWKFILFQGKKKSEVHNTIHILLLCKIIIIIQYQSLHTKEKLFKKTKNGGMNKEFNEKKIYVSIKS